MYSVLLALRENHGAHKERTAGNGPEQGETVTFPEWTAAEDAFAPKWLNTNEAQWWEHSPPSFARSHM